jgi:hypothetical protein
VRSVDDFVDELLTVQKHPEAGYGGNVLPAAKIYSDIADREEAKAYREALSKLLSSPDPDIRRFAINLCLGFFVFYDVIPRPRLKDG